MNRNRQMRPWLRNVTGVLLMLAGIIMLFTPGQGLLTILAGFLMLDFPGKKRMLRKMLSHPGIGPLLIKTHSFLKKRFQRKKKDLPKV